MSTDYKSTILLPKTNFSMRAGLPNYEPKVLEQWEENKIYDKIREKSKNREKFILHDGPPYANGHIHIGTALNKILKDIVSRSQQMMGKNSHYIPGWDCHGLPIEWQVEQQYRKSGKDKDAIPINDFRKECRDFADKWISIQKSEFQRLGVTGDWKNRYVTMDYSSEAKIAGEIFKFLMNGGLYRGSKPVMWSVVEKTALAEAEVEYHDQKTETLVARFSISSSSEKFKNTSILIWTTTPWTIPGNRAIAYNEKIEYSIVRIDDKDDDSKAFTGEKVIIASDAIERLKSDSNVLDLSIIDTFLGEELSDIICSHPLKNKGYDYQVPLLPAEFVNTEQGTGFVHIAPQHGSDDYELGQKFQIKSFPILDYESKYLDSVPIFSGEYVLKPNGKPGNANHLVIKNVEEEGGLFSSSKYTHSYPHSWRSKAPVIFLSTPQWFISMSQNELRKKALNAIDNVKWFPSQGRSRIYSMIQNRPEWVISRQRAWGVPIPIFINRTTGELLKDESVNKKIIKAFEEEGSDSWFSDEDGKRFLGDKYDKSDWEKVTDIVDVWFESGSSHAFVLENNEQLLWPASLYLEGTDQHRGWFHSSLLESCGTRGTAPFDSVLTHGFVMDGNGRKMSKSLGNVVSPQKVIDRYGADILRLWVVGSDYTDDVRISDEILKGEIDTYRKIRNTLRFLLGNLHGYSEKEFIPYANLPSLEKWVLNKLFKLDITVRESYNKYDFHNVYKQVRNFCFNDLSAFYFDVRKDSLYCDSANSQRRQSARTTLNYVFKFVSTWLAPILCFTMEEVWLNRYGENKSSIHLEDFPKTEKEWGDYKEISKWEIIKDVRKVVTGAIEVERKAKKIGSSLEVSPIVYLNKEKYLACESMNMQDICITSNITLIESDPPSGSFNLDEVSSVGVEIKLAKGEKCERCWKILEDVSKPESICSRCFEVING